MTLTKPQTFTSLQALQDYVIDIIAEKAHNKYVATFHSGPEPTQQERINASGLRINYKETTDEVFTSLKRAQGLILTGDAASQKPQGGIIELDGIVYVDLAGREYLDLPKDHQALNQKSARVTVRELIRASEALHDAWVMNNSWLIAGAVGNNDIYDLTSSEEIYDYVARIQSPEVREKLQQFVPFGELSTEEQNKDFDFVVETAITLSKTLGLTNDPEEIHLEAIDGLALGIQVASAVHDEWVMSHLQDVADATLDNSVLEMENASEVYGFVSNQSGSVRDRLDYFVPFSELREHVQARSLAFVIEAAQEIQDRMTFDRDSGMPML